MVKMARNSKMQIAAGNKGRIFWITLALLLGLTGSIFAQDISFEATVDQTRVSKSRGMQLNLIFYGIQDIPAPELPDIDGFDWRYLGPSKRISIVNRKTSSSVTHMYTLIPLKIGTLEIPSLTAQYKGQTYLSKPISIEVVRGPVSQPPSGQQPSQQISEAQELGDRIFIVMQVGKKRLYVNETTPLIIKLYVNGLSIRDIQYPQFPHQGFSVDEFAKPRQYQETLNGIGYDVIEFNTNIFGTHPGRPILGPAELRCNLMLRRQTQRRSRLDDDFFSSGFFSRFSWGNYEKYPLELEAAHIPIVIKPLPSKNIPADYGGAVGNYRFSLEAKPKQVKVGDPITLKMTISGEGNFKTVNIPSLNFGDAFKVYEPELKQDEGVKTFKQVIIPKSDTIKEIPEVSFSFFDTNLGKYSTIAEGPVSIKVIPLARDDQLRVFELPGKISTFFRKKEILGRDIIYIKEAPGKLSRKGQFLCKDKIFIAIQLIPLLGIILILIFHKRSERLKTDIPYARRLRAPGKARKNLRRARGFLKSKQTDKFFEAAFKTLQEYLGDKFHLPTAGITSDIVEDLRERNVVDQNLLGMIGECFGNCDAARYAPASITDQQMLDTFKLLWKIIDALERAKI